MSLTIEQQASYVANDTSICPNCGSDDIEAEVVQFDCTEASVHVMCNHCDSAWYDIYV